MISIIIFTIVSCSTIREKNANRFFNKWEKNSKALSQNKNEKLNKLNKSVYEIFNLLNCFSKNDIYITTNEYPKLKYNIINAEVKVSVLENNFIINQNDSLDISYNPFKISIKDSILKIQPKENEHCLKYLYLTSKYKKKVFERSNLLYGFAYASAKTEKSKQTGRAIIGKHHLSNHFSIGGITEIIFNKKIDSAIVSIRGIYTESESLYVFNEKTKKWNIEKELGYSIE